jgi:membrane-associated phospholipid phosphatase
MTLVTLLGWVGGVTLALVGLSLAVIVGRGPVVGFYRDPFGKLRRIAPYVVFLAVALLVTSVVRRYGPDLSWLIGFQIGGDIYAIEGNFVEWLQTLGNPTVTGYFALVYIYGYVYLLVFPFLAYALLEDLRSFRVLIMAYVLNYVLGLVCYILFIAYGPRNFLVGESLLYQAWPQSQLLTSTVNVNTNVFPSLHASLSMTVAIIALRTRDAYPRWPLVAVPMALSVCGATMYLGIHWATDVVAGAVLAVVSVRGGDLLHDRFRRGIDETRQLWHRVVEAAPVP